MQASFFEPYAPAPSFEELMDEKTSLVELVNGMHAILMDPKATAALISFDLNALVFRLRTMIWTSRKEKRAPLSYYATQAEIKQAISTNLNPVIEKLTNILTDYQAIQEVTLLRFLVATSISNQEYESLESKKKDGYSFNNLLNKARLSAEDISELDRKCKKLYGKEFFNSLQSYSSTLVLIMQEFKIQPKEIRDFQPAILKVLFMFDKETVYLLANKEKEKKITFHQLVDLLTVKLSECEILSGLRHPKRGEETQSTLHSLITWFFKNPESQEAGTFRVTTDNYGNYPGR